MPYSDYYTHKVHGDYELVSIGDLELEEGGTLQDVKLAVMTYGKLNEAKDNAILIPTWYSGTHSTWRDVYIGDNHALDPSRYFIICINQIGSGLSTSPHQAESPELAAKFPNVRIGDDVVAQERLIREHFGINRLALVVGGSMGAMQTYEWAVRFPDKVLRAAPIAGTSRNSQYNVLFVQTLMEAITSDPGFADGTYTLNEQVKAGLERHARIFGVVGFSTEFFKIRHYSGLGFEDLDSFLKGFLEPYFSAMDPNNLLCMAWKWQHCDVSGHTGGDLREALGRITAKTFVMPIDEDMFFPVRDCAADQSLIPNSELRVIASLSGHLGLFGLEPEYIKQVDKHLEELLATPV
jgi:homoserine O-acetyltransferase